MTMPRPIAERLAEKVERVPESGCWIWMGGVCSGYGAIKADRSRRQLQTHRAAYELANGPIPSGMCVCHRCDVKLCVNPAHLFLGTHKDNIADMFRKGREHKPRGEANGMARLTEDQVRAIRGAVGSQSEIAQRFGVAQTLVSQIRRRVLWKHL